MIANRQNIPTGNPELQTVSDVYLGILSLTK